MSGRWAGAPKAGSATSRPRATSCCSGRLNSHLRRRRLGRFLCSLVLLGHHRIAVLERATGVKSKALCHLWERARRSLQLDEVPEVEDVERNRDAVEHPDRAPLGIRPADAEAQLLEHVHGGVDVLDLDLGLLAALDARVELRRAFGREDAVRAAVQDAKAERRVARRLARTVEAEVLLAVVPADLRPALAQHRAQPAVVIRPGKPELELGLDAAVSLRPPRH